MPCYDERSSAEWQLKYNWKPSLDAATRAACEAMTALENENMIGLLSREVRVWWEDHKEQDRERLAREKEERERKRLAKRARDRLSPKERKALGLK